MAEGWFGKSFEDEEVGEEKEQEDGNLIGKKKSPLANPPTLCHAQSRGVSGGRMLVMIACHQGVELVIRMLLGADFSFR